MIIPSIESYSRSYALLKTHKHILAFHPIAFNIGTDSYKLAWFFLQSVAHLTCNNLYTMKNFYDSEDKLKHISPSNYTMLSLDVKSLCINISIQGVLDCLEKKVHEFHCSFIETEEILGLVHLCVRQTTFVFNGVFYSRIDGLRMWSPFSPLLSDIYVFHFDEKLFSVYKFPHFLGMLMILSFLFLAILTFLVWCFWLIPSIIVFSSLFKLKTTILFRFLMLWILSTLTSSRSLSSENPSQSLSLFMLFLIILLNRKELLSILTFILLYRFTLILLISPINLII